MRAGNRLRATILHNLLCVAAAYAGLPAATAAQTEVTTVGKWEVVRFVDPITDAGIITLKLPSEEGTQPDGQPFILTINCLLDVSAGGPSNVSIEWGGDNMLPNVTTRFGHDEPGTTRWSVRGVFTFSRSSSEFITRLLIYDRFVARAERNLGPPTSTNLLLRRTLTGIWDTTGFDEALADDLEICGLAAKPIG